MAFPLPIAIAVLNLISMLAKDLGKQEEATGQLPLEGLEGLLNSRMLAQKSPSEVIIKKLDVAQSLTEKHVALNDPFSRYLVLSQTRIVSYSL